MKRFTFMLLAAFIAVVAFAQKGNLKSMEAHPFTPAKNMAAPVAMNLKQAPKGLALKTVAKTKARRAAKKAVAVADLVGDYQWDYLQSSETSTDLESLTTTAGSSHVVISKSATTEGGIAISGMSTNDLEATVVNAEGSDYFQIEGGQIAGTSSYGDYALYGMFYYEGDDEDAAGWYYGDIYGYVKEDGSITIGNWIVRVLSGGTYNGYSLTPYWVEGSTLTPAEPLASVQLPAGVEAIDYVMKYDGGATPVKVAVDGNDVYFQGMSEYIPDAWVKGTKDGNTVTFAAMQYMGEYGSYGSSYFFYNGETVFTYDAEADTYSAEGQVYGVLADRYYDGNYTNPVIALVVEKAAMPANPEITDLTNGNYGWVFNFNVPVVDVNGDGLVASKLSYMVYTDIEGEIAPLTFTPATHSRLTEDMAEIPYGFTEDYDFYPTNIYLNDLYSANWNNLGIQSIYRGGDEENATEIQWFHIKDYAAATTDVTFDFNAMDLPMSHAANGDVPASTEGDITETAVFTEGGVTLAISPKEETTSTENRFWAFTVGENTVPQLRMYSGTMTFTAPEGATITSIVFNYQGKYWGGSNNGGKVTPDNGTIQDTKNGVATWTGAAQEVVLTIAANTQLNSIVVTVAAEGGEPQPIEPAEGTLFTFDDGTMEGWTTIDADGDGYCWIVNDKSAGGQIATHNDSNGSVFSQSYENNVGALTPDNFLVSPLMKLDGKISFYACAQDASYPAEVFGVAVSTKGNTDAADFEMVQDWTMTAARDGYEPTNARIFRGPKKAAGTWYQFTVDLSQYEGAEGYVAIRHFDCSDNFYLVVDDITLETSQIILPDYTIIPAEGTVKSLSDFTMTFNNYDVAIVEGEAAQAELYKDENFDEPFATAALSLNENVLSFSFDDITEAGAYTLLIPEGTLQNVTEEKILGDLEFFYTIEAAPEVVVLPEGLTAETWYLNAAASESTIKNQEVAVAIDGSDIYIQGLNVDYLPEAWVKGTIDAEAGTATFATGQYFGAFDYNGTEYDMFFVGTEDGSSVSDVVFAYDAEAATLTTDMYIVISAQQAAVSYYEYYSGATITREPAEVPELVELPEGVEPEEWALEGFWGDGASGNDVQRAVGVAFDGTDVYVQGLAYYFEESWLKGTIDAETGIVTFPSGQLVGEDDYGREYMVGFDGETFCDIHYAYDAEAKTLTQVTPFVMESQTETGLDEEGEFAFWGIWEVSYLYAGEPVEKEAVEAPEGLETETYLFSAMELVEEEEDADRARVLKAEGDVETVTFDFNAMTDEPCSNNGHEGDISEEGRQFVADNVTLTVSASTTSTANRFWNTNDGPQLRVYGGTMTFDVPEGYTMSQIVFNNGKWNDGNAADSGEFDGATWTGNAQNVVVTIAGNTQINSINVTVAGGGDEPTPVDPDEPTLQPYTTQIQVGFDGNDVYFSGINDNTADMWMKGTLSEDGTTVTIPANQYMGFISSWFSVYDFYMTAVNEEGEFTDLVLNFDAENNKFTTDQTVMLNGSRFVYYPYQTFTEVEITKMPEFAATPADPSIGNYKFEGTSYPYIDFVIPAQDVDGNDILASKLFYTVWTEVDGVEEPFVVRADEYRDVTEDMTEIPYNWDDGYDIYKGGSRFYINPASVLAYWIRIGIQSIYYGGGERNVSEIAWMENPVKDPTATGITTVKADDLKGAAIYNLAGQRLQTVQKGLNIINGRKVVIK